MSIPGHQFRNLHARMIGDRTLCILLAFSSIALSYLISSVRAGDHQYRAFNQTAIELESAHPTSLPPKCYDHDHSMPLEQRDSFIYDCQGAVLKFNLAFPDPGPIAFYSSDAPPPLDYRRVHVPISYDDGDCTVDLRVLNSGEGFVYTTIRAILALLRQQIELIGDENCLDSDSLIFRFPDPPLLRLGMEIRPDNRATLFNER